MFTRRSPTRFLAVTLNCRFPDSGVLRLGAKLGPINWQLTPGKRFDPEDYARFLELLPAEVRGVPLRHALEVRDAKFLHS